MATKKTTKTVEAQKATDNTSESSSISLHGKTFEGTVVSAKAHKTVSVQWDRRRLVPKYERYEKRRSKVAAHVPEGMTLREGDEVRIQECRPLSKTKHFVVTEIIKRSNA